MVDVIRIKRRLAPGATGAPSSLATAELAYNEADNILYYGKGDNGAQMATNVIPIGGPGYSAGGGPYLPLTAGATVPLTGVLQFGGTYASSPPVINKIDFFNGGTGPGSFGIGLSAGSIDYISQAHTFYVSSAGSEAVGMVVGTNGVVSIPGGPLLIGGAANPAGATLAALRTPGASPVNYWDIETASFQDGRAMAAGVGGGLAFQGQYTTAGAWADYGGILAQKANATSGDATGNLMLWARQGGVYLLAGTGQLNNGIIGAFTTNALWLSPRGTYTDFYINAVGGITIGYTPAPGDLYTGAVIMNQALTSNGGSVLFQNAYVGAAGAAKLLNTGPAAALNMGSGGFQFYNAPSAAAGTAPAWAQIATFGTNGLWLSGNHLYFAGAGGDVNTTGGPLFYVDANTIVFKMGSGTNGWWFQNYAGTNVASINTSGWFSAARLQSTGDIVCGNSLYPSYNNSTAFRIYYDSGGAKFQFSSDNWSLQWRSSDGALIFWNYQGSALWYVTAGGDEHLNGAIYLSASNNFWGMNSGYMYTNASINSAGDIAANGYLRCSGINGPAWSNSSGYMYTGSPILSGSNIIAGGSLYAGGTGGGYISWNGWMYCPQGYLAGGNGLYSYTSLHCDGAMTCGSNMTVSGNFSTTGCMDLNVNSNSKCWNHMAAQDNSWWCGVQPWTQSWGAVGSYAFVNASDAREKTDFADLPTCLDLVQAIRPRRYRLINAPVYDRWRLHWGFVAQDVGAAMEAAGHDFGGHYREDHPFPAPPPEVPKSPRMQALAPFELMAVLWKAVQELSDEVATLKARVA